MCWSYLDPFHKKNEWKRNIFLISVGKINFRIFKPFCLTLEFSIVSGLVSTNFAICGQVFPDREEHVSGRLSGDSVVISVKHGCVHLDKSNVDPLVPPK